MMRVRPNRVLLAGLAAVALAKAAALSDRGPEWASLRLDPLGWAATAATSGDEATEMDGEDAPPVPAACEMPEEALEAIRAERALLAVQREAAAAREADLELDRETLRIESEHLSRLRDELAAFMARVEAAQSADLERLVALYRGMKPKDAAEIMNELDMEVLIAVMGGMAARDAAPIMAQLDPGRARAISRLMLERAKLPGDRNLDNISLR